MDWALAISRNRDALLRLLAAMFAAAGIVPGQSVATLSRHAHTAILRVLRPAEFAARRLIVVAALGLSVSVRPARPFPAAELKGKRAGERMPSFPLLDPMKRFGETRPCRPARAEPRVWSPDWPVPDLAPKPVPSPDDPVSAERLCRRLRALQHVLDNLPGQARRLARWRARRDRASGPRRVSGLRPGRPPGHRSRPSHEVDDILNDCHGLARYAMEPPDTS